MSPSPPVCEVLSYTPLLCNPTVKNHMELDLDFLEAIHEVRIVLSNVLENVGLTTHAHFPECWMGRRGPHEWPPRSLDLTQCDFYLWGYTKEKVYKKKPRILEDLERRIREVLNDNPNDVLQKVVNSISGRLRKLVDTTGAYVEM